MEASSAASPLLPARKEFVLALLLLVGSLARIASSDGARYDYKAYTECKSHPEPALYSGGILRWASKLTDFRAEDEGNYSPAFVLYNMSAATIYSFSCWVKIDGPTTAHVKARILTLENAASECLGTALARNDCWSFLKGGFTLNNASQTSVLYFQTASPNASTISIRSASLQPFSPDQWNQHREDRIQLNRKRFVNIHVADSNGSRVVGAKVAVRQITRDFPLGSAISKTILGNKPYQQEVQRGGVRERAQVVRDGAVPGEGGLRAGGPAAAVRAVQRRDGARAQHLLGGPQVHAGVGQEPHRHAAPRRRGRPHREPPLPLQGRLRALGRQQRAAPLRLLREPPRRQRHRRVLRHRQERRPARHALPQRLQRRRGLRRPQLQRRLVRLAPPPARRRRRHLRGHRPRGPLRQAQHPLRARRAGQARHPSPSHLAHGDRHQQLLPSEHSGCVPGGGAPGRIRASSGERHHAVDRHGRQRELLPDVPDEPELEQPPCRGRGGQAPGGMADQASPRSNQRPWLLQLQCLSGGIQAVCHLSQLLCRGHLLVGSQRRHQAYQHPLITLERGERREEACMI